MKYKLLILIGVLLVSFSPVLVKLIDLEASVIAMYRLGIGGVLLLPFAFKHKTIKNIKRNDLLLFGLAGFVISIHYISWFTALNFTSVTSSTLIICTQPLVALSFGFLLYKEKITRQQFFYLLIALSGVLFVAYGDVLLSMEAIIGDILTFLAVILYVVYLMIGKHVVQTYSFVVYTSLLFLSAAIILLIYNVSRGYDLVGFDLKIWIILILMGTIPNAGQTIFIYTLRYVKSSLVATSILLEPVIASILVIIILGDRITFNHLIGGLVIIPSVYFYIKKDQIDDEQKL